MSNTLVCEIINPSDTYTLETRDFVVAGVAVAILGQGAYGLKELPEGQRTPVMFGWDEWFQKNNCVPDDAYIAQHGLEMAAILDSIIIGDEDDRKIVKTSLRMLSSEDGEKWLAQWNDRKRSSLNDIGKQATILACCFRDRVIGRAEKEQRC